MKFTVTLPDGEHVVNFDEAYGKRTLEVDGEAHVLTLLRVEGGRVRFTVDDQPVDALIAGDLPELRVDAGDGPVSLRVEESRFAEVRKISGLVTVRRGAPDLKAPMPGLVTRVLVKSGDPVDVGTPLVVMEAMKMENELRSQGRGTVDRIYAEAGEAVEQGAVLVTFTSEASP